MTFSMGFSTVLLAIQWLCVGVFWWIGKRDKRRFEEYTAKSAENMALIREAVAAERRVQRLRLLEMPRYRYRRIPGWLVAFVPELT